jgi:hypothetical protein
MPFDTMMAFIMASELPQRGQNIIAQGKDEVRNPGYSIPSKNLFRPVGAAQNASIIFVRPFQGRKNGMAADPSVLPWAMMWRPFRTQSKDIVV